MTIEEEMKRLEPIIQRFSSMALTGKKIVIKGKENFVKKGPNIIIGNHIGTFKDAAILFKVVPRQIFWTSNKLIFDKHDLNRLIRKHFKRHLKDFGLFLDLIFSPLKSLFTSYFAKTIKKAGAIPVDMEQKTRTAMEHCHEYLKKGRAIIALQGWGRVMKKESNPYVHTFKRGTSILSYNLHKHEGISIPVTPVAMFGTQVPFLVPTKIKINVGEPMYITDYLGDGFTDSVERFREALEENVKRLLFDILKW